MVIDILGSRIISRQTATPLPKTGSVCDMRVISVFRATYKWRQKYESEFCYFGGLKGKSAEAHPSFAP